MNGYYFLSSFSNPYLWSFFSISLLGWPWRYNGVQCRHGPCLQNVYGLVSREVSSTVLLATWVLLCYAAKREKKSLGCFGNHCTETKNKKQRDFRKRHFKLNISNSSSFLLFPQSCSSLRILSQYRTLLSTQLLKAKC